MRALSAWLFGVLSLSALLAISLDIYSPLFAQSLPSVEPVEAEVGDILSYELMSESAGFAVLMPSPPATQILQPDDVLQEGVMYVQLRVEDNQQLSIFVAGYADYGGDLSAPSAVDRALDGFLLNFAAGTEIFQQQELNLNGYRGRELEGGDRSSLNVMRAYVVGHRLYFVGGLFSPFAFLRSPAQRQDSVTRPVWMDEYFDSFRILPQ